MIAFAALKAAVSRAPSWLWYVLAGLAIAAVIALYGRSERNQGREEGRAQEEALWKAAEQKLLEKAAQASTDADKQAAARAADYAADVAEERNAINEAIQNGTSPMDALFGAER